MPTRWEVTKAVRASDLPAPSRLVMLVLADVAEVGTAEIPGRFTPSLNVLARESGLAKSTVAAHLADLEESKWIIRERPDEAGMARGERTKYRLTFPWAVDPEGDGTAQDPVQEPDHPSPGSGQPLSGTRTTPVQQADHPSPGDGQLYKEVRSSSDHSDLPPTADAGKPRRPIGRPINAGDVVGAYVDGAKAGGQPTPPEKLRKRVGKEASTLLADKTQDPNLVLQAGFDAGRVGWLDLAVQMQRTAAARKAAQNGRNPPTVYRDPIDPDAYNDWEKPQ